MKKLPQTNQKKKKKKNYLKQTKIFRGSKETQ